VRDVASYRRGVGIWHGQRGIAFGAALCIRWRWEGIKHSSCTVQNIEHIQHKIDGVTRESI
jgi:hypothetical protein